jgi:SAM-dependent methyltransferase
MAERVDYDRVAPSYDERYRHGDPTDVAELVRRIAAGSSRVLEVGCGTGHWLPMIGACGCQTFGLDRSRGMLERARTAGVPLVQADACRLPLRGGSLDAILCINALHHFGDGRGFVAGAFGALRPRGSLVIAGMDPAAGLDRWYLYDYFPGTLQTDEARYPPAATIAGWMNGAGFAVVERGLATRLHGVARGAEVHGDPILSRHGTSQLSLLSDGEFAAGMQRIDAAITANPGVEFVTDISLALIVGRKT